MENTQNLVQTTLAEIEKVLNTKTVFGDPITIEGKTIIPLIAAGFGFGVGSGTGKATGGGPAGEGGGGGAGGGAGVKPVGIVIIDENGIRIEPIKHGLGAALEKMVDKMPDICEKMMERWEMKKQGGTPKTGQEEKP